MNRGPPPEVLCGVFKDCGQSLALAEFKRCVARAALALAPMSEVNDMTGDQKLCWLLRQIPARIDNTKLPVLDVQRRVRVLAAAEHLTALLS
jgi:hypothetical protein